MAVEMEGEDQLKAVCFAAGASAFMACIERSLFAHWRVWAFLALNLLLLAILLTSKSQFPPNDVNKDDVTNSETLKGKKKRQEEECRQLVSGNEGDEVSKLPVCVENETKSGEDAVKEEQEEEVQNELSKEELNKRVEAFIAMFRQHLVSDAKTNKKYRLHQLNSTTRASFSYDYKYVSTGRC